MPELPMKYRKMYLGLEFSVVIRTLYVGSVKTGENTNQSIFGMSELPMLTNAGMGFQNDDWELPG